MRTLSHIAAALLLMVLMASVWRIAPFETASPDAALVVALYLGVSSRGAAWEATIAALMIGYLEDVIAGAPRGLGAFVLGAVCLLVRLATGRLLVRGAMFIAVVTFLGAIAAAGLTMAVRAYFGAVSPRLGPQLVAIVGSALLTAIIGPVVFRICRWIDARFARTAREREALRDGLLS